MPVKLEVCFDTDRKDKDAESGMLHSVMRYMQDLLSKHAELYKITDKYQRQTVTC